MRVGETGSAEIGHRVGLAPHDVVQDPEVRVLQQGADAIDVVIAANDPDGAVVLEDAPGLGEPLTGEIVIGRQAIELVPLVIAGVDLAPLGPEQVATELEVVRRVGEDHVDRLVGEFRHFGDAVAFEDGVEREFLLPRNRARARTPVALRYRQDHVHMGPSFELDVLDESGRTRGQGGASNQPLRIQENKRNPGRVTTQHLESPSIRRTQPLVV